MYILIQYKLVIYEGYQAHIYSYYYSWVNQPKANTSSFIGSITTVRIVRLFLLGASLKTFTTESLLIFLSSNNFYILDVAISRRPSGSGNSRSVLVCNINE